MAASISAMPPVPEPVLVRALPPASWKYAPEPSATACAIRPSNTSGSVDASDAGSAVRFCVPAAAAVRLTLAVLVIAASFCEPDTPRNHAYANAPFTAAMDAVRLDVLPLVVAAAPAEGCAENPVILSVDPSALLRVYGSLTPLATLESCAPFRVKATQVSR